MGKITPTFADNLRAGNGSGPKASPFIPIITSAPHIEAAHEPIKDEPFKAPIGSPSPALPNNMSANVKIVPQPLKIAIVGTAPSSRGLAPYGDPSWKIWACSPGNMTTVPRADAWFEIHGNLLWPENKHYGEPYLEWLKKLPIPIYMQDQSIVPNAVIYPKDEMVKEFGREFFTSSFSWMMALAISQGANEIALYGVDMASRDEYILQRPGFYYFKREAERRGIKISAPNESDIMQPPGLYGYDDIKPFGRKLLARAQEIKDRLNGMRQQRDQLAHNITYLEGALEDLDYMTAIWMGQG